ncbi:MAG: O-antigen ligase family protein, partial [Acidobacteriaceae bacterium]
MQLVTLLPMFACIWVLYRKNTQTAFLWVVLPCLLLTPSYFSMILRPLPGLTMIECSVLPVMVAIVIFGGLRWRPSLMDVWVILFLVSAGYGDKQVGKSTQAIFTWFAGTITFLGFYMAGKMLIEQTGFRNKVVRLFVLLVAFSSIVSSFEYFFRSNPYSRFWSHFYPSQYAPFTTQIRWGFGRMAGLFGQSEIAGIVMATAWLFALWIGRTNFQEDYYAVRPKSVFVRGKLLLWATFVALFMTQARGPWIGAAMGLCVANIGRAQRPLLRAFVVVALLIGVGIPVYTLGKDYIAGPRKNYGSEKETAQYRAQLIDNYIPVAQRGGAWGYGLNFPQMGGQDSIDNEYLLVWLTQGWVGLSALVLILAHTLLTLIVAAVRASTTRERHFALTMIGILVTLGFTISTVYLGGQTPSLLFLLVGWAQSIRAPKQADRWIQNEEMYRAPAQSRLAG